MKVILTYIAHALLSLALDRGTRTVIKAAVEHAESQSGKGQQKMAAALQYVAAYGTRELKRKTEGQLRTLLEEQHDRLTKR